MSSADALSVFADALAAAGLVVEGLPVADGALHRCGVAGKPHGKDGSYRIHLDAPACCWWCNWGTGDAGTRTLAPEKEMSAAERKALRERIAAARKAAEEEQSKRHAAAAKLARILWERATPAPDSHPYLVRKQVPALGLRQDAQGRLVVPVRDADGGLASLQFILPEKPVNGPDKLFMKGGRTAGGWFAIPAKDGRTDGPLLIAEGFATAASLNMSTGHACLVAFNAGNLSAVACLARERYPEREIIVCGDNDCETVKPDGTPWNTGKEAATKAAQAAGAKLAVCPAHEGRATDFNDLHCRRSLEAVRQVVEAARKEGGAVHLPEGFFIREGGKNPGLFKTETRGDERVDLRIGPPLRIIGKTFDDVSDNWGTFLSWKDPAGTEHRWALPDDLLQGQGREYAQILARGGYSIAPGQATKFATFIQGVRTERFVTCVQRIGWHAAALSEAAYMLANGQAKGRASRDGIPRALLTWRLLFLSSGELGLADKLAENGLKSRGGQEVRFVGLPVDKAMLADLHGLPDAGAVADRLKMLCAEHYGHAGRAFLHWLCVHREEVASDLRDNLADLAGRLCPPDATEQVRRVAKRFALVLAGGLAAQKAGLLPEDMDIRRAVQSCLTDWLEARGGTGPAEDAAILAQVRLFIERHGASRFQDVDTEQATCINRVGFRQKRPDGGTEYLILPESFGAEVVRGHASRRAAAVLRKAGWLRRSDDRAAALRTLPELGRRRVYVVALPDDGRDDPASP